VTSEWPDGKSEMAARVREHDWSSTPLGPSESWPPALKRAAEIALGAPLASVLLWGPDHIIAAYNDGYRVVLGSKPDVFGRRVLDVWNEDRAILEPQLARVLRGETLLFRELPMILLRGPASDESWFDYGYGPVRDDSGAVAGLIVSILEVTDRVVAQRTLRASEERQAFLLRLSDTLRPVTDPGEVLQTAMRLVGEHFGVDSAVYHEFDEKGGRVITRQGVTNDRIVLPDIWELGDFGFEKEVKAGKTIWYEDTETDPRLKDCLTSYRATGIRSGLGVTLMKRGRLAAMIGLTDSRPRAWSQDQRSLVERVAERTWEAVERARAELALRDSEVRFQQFGKASAAGLWIRDATNLTMEYVSPAMGTIYGVRPEDLLGDVAKWAALLVPEDRDGALGHVESARQGKAGVHEFRIRRQSDQSFRWIRSTDFPLEQDGHVGRIGGIAEDVTDAKLAVQHQAILLAELQHRVRNIMAMIRSMANRTADGSLSVREYRELLEGRLLALVRVQALLMREANAGGSLQSILESEISAQADSAGQYELNGPEIMLPPKMVEVLTLAFHELATNALKYGALSVSSGRLAVTWHLLDRRGRTWLALDWSETGAPPRAPPERRGFGSELIEKRIPYELKGSGRLSFEPDGVRCHMELPLQEGESVLETDAPVSTVFGGSLDMRGAPDLTGKTVMVVEDDFYLANDTAAALASAGAEVMGPYPRDDDVHLALQSTTPDAAVVDLNLGGGGPQFAIARLLKERGIPFVFFTGYDPGVIPAEMADIKRLQKPLPLRSLVEAVAGL